MELTKKEIHEVNELIAIFMGGEPVNKVIGNPIAYSFPFEFGYKTVHDEGGYVGSGPSSCWIVTDLMYDTSWDWLFPVIDKINSLGKEYQFSTFKTYCSCSVEKGGRVFKDFSFAHAEYITATQTSKEAVYKLIVKFVKWHNQNITPKDLVALF